MALATQCPHCLTIFRVAGDQLKLRGGLVRCGSCRQVFNGDEFLVESSVSDGHYHPAPGSKAQTSLAAAVPPSSSPPALTPQAAQPVRADMPGTSAIAAVPAPVMPQAAPPGHDGASTQPAAPIPLTPEPKVFRSPASPGYIPDLGAPLNAMLPAGRDLPEEPPVLPLPDQILASSFSRSAEPDSDRTPAQPFGEEDRSASDTPLAHVTPEMEDDPVSAYEQAAEVATMAMHQPETTDQPDEEGEEPAFVKHAQRKERIGHVARMVMMILAGAMVPLLLLQSLYHWRNPLAAAVPALRPMLNGMCVTFHCTVGLPAEIDRLSLEANELQVMPPNQNMYTLSLVMRNRGPVAQAWPHIELTLNNDDEKAVIRRVFRPREYLSGSQSIDAGIAGESEQQVRLSFDLSDVLVSGYRIYLFYP